MTETHRNIRVSEMPAQHATDPVTPAQRRARFFNSGNAFNVQLPKVPDMAFADEPARALDPETPTGMILCDISDQLECPFPATSPLVLAGYARIRAGERLTTDPRASGVIGYVIQGRGTTRSRLRSHGCLAIWSGTTRTSSSRRMHRRYSASRMSTTQAT
jgi:hypothetical protein